MSPSVTEPLLIVNFTKIIFDHAGSLQGKAEHLAEGWKANYWEPLEKYLSWAGRSIFPCGYPLRYRMGLLTTRYRWEWLAEAALA